MICTPYNALSVNVVNQLRKAPATTSTVVSPSPTTSSSSSSASNVAVSCPETPDGGLSVGVILAIVLPIIALLLLAAGIVALCIVRHRKAQQVNVKVEQRNEKKASASSKAKNVEENWEPEE